MQYFQDTNLDFVGKRKFFTWFSISLNVLSIILVLVFPPQLGIDFKGGAEIAIAMKDNVSIQDLRSNLNKSDINGLELKSFGLDNQYLIRVPDTEKGSELVTDNLNQNYKDRYEVLKVDKIGPKIGSEMFLNSLWAVLLAIIAMLLYLAFRFEFIFGLGAVIALLHDVVITMLFITIFHHLGWMDIEVNQAFIAGILTVVGYSVNDTVIIFDRIRENREKHKGLTFTKLVNLSINETLSRTINTTVTVIGVLLILVLFGGPVLQSFAFIMFIGILTGTYSTMFIASNIVIWYYHDRHEKKPQVSTSPNLAK